MVRVVFVLSSLVALATLVGCGDGFDAPEGVIVTGKIVQGGQPVSVAPTPDGYNGVEVRLEGASPEENLDSTGTTCDANGNFELIYAGEGIRPGKYKLVVMVHQGGADTDTLNGKLSAENTKIEVDIPKDKVGSKHDLGTIDIATHLQ